jgi:N-acetylmuramoyl-L-alanine amidase
MLVCLDAGHGGRDPGACGAYSKEKDIALVAVKKLGDILKELGFEVVYTRKEDVYVKLSDRAKIANSAKADVFISVHCNSATGSSSNGTETLCYEKCKLAENIQYELIYKTGLRDRGLKIRKDLAVLNSTKMTAVLVELAFISNTHEESLLNDNTWIAKSVKAIAKGLCSTYGVLYRMEESEMITETEMNIGGKSKKVKRILKDGENYVRLRDLESIVNIGYDAATKVVSVSSK